MATKRCGTFRGHAEVSYDAWVSSGSANSGVSGAKVVIRGLTRFAMFGNDFFFIDLGIHYFSFYFNCFGKNWVWYGMVW